MHNNSKFRLVIPSESELESMIQMENRLRFGDKYLAECTAVATQPNGWLAVTERLQSDIVSAHGYTTPMAQTLALNCLRRAQYMYPSNPVFRTPVYVRENAARQGPFGVGDAVPNIQIHNLVGDAAWLPDLTQGLTIMVSGSYT